MSGASSLQPGTLWPRVLATTANALAVGALRPITTTLHLVEEAGIPFLVRVPTGRHGPEAAAQKEAHANVEPGPAAASGDAPASARPAFDPFLPYEPAMFVADLSASHLCLLNKFNVIDHHLLIVTRDYVEQDAPLTEEDFTALAACLGEVEGLAFYNGGKLAGASQRHKHLQLAPFPLGRGDTRLPVEAALLRDEPATTPAPVLRNWPFPHAFVRSAEPWPQQAEAAGRRLWEQHRSLLAALHLERTDAAGHLPPYNWLATREWAMLVPRQAEACAGINVNGLGFAGSLLVRDEALLRYVMQQGPLHVLRCVSGGQPAVTQQS